MSPVLYSLLALGATILGSMTGIGGGVIVKPVMDLLGDFDATTIGLLSSITVFSMAVVSLIKSRGNSGIQDESWSSVSRLVVLGFGSVAGGFMGQYFFNITTNVIQNNNLIIIIQNLLLLVILAIVFVYVLCSNKIAQYKFTSHFIYALSGMLLGVLSSFLGIGGGPMNVALLMFLFSFDIKTSMFASILVIFFSQFTKLVMVLFTTGFADYDLSLAPYMIICAIIGGFVGTWIKKIVTTKTVTVLFNCVQVVIMGICVMNIAKSIN